MDFLRSRQRCKNSGRVSSLPGCCLHDGIEEMQEVFANRRIGAHDECQVSLWSGKAPGALDEAVPERIQDLKLPCRGSLGPSPQGCGSGEHLELPRQVVGQHCAQGKGLVGRQASGSSDIEGNLVFWPSRTELPGSRARCGTRPQALPTRPCWRRSPCIVS